MPDTLPLHNTVAEIRLDRLRHNARLLQRLAGDVPLMAVVKADAYGHGAARVVPVLQDEGIRHFAVATLPEAIALREKGLSDDLLIFAAPRPHHVSHYAQHDLSITISSEAIADCVIAAARQHGPLSVHLKVDTGMRRVGLPVDRAVDVARRLGAAPGVRLVGLWTHLATADTDATYAREQMARLRPVVDAVGDLFERVHVANSDGLLVLRDQLDIAPRGPALVRAGIALYGMAGDHATAEAAGLRPVLRFTSRVTQIREIPAGASVSYGRLWTSEHPTRIATVAAGYADGYSRLYTNRADVGIRGARFPVVGAVCMDMFMVDLGADPAGRSVEEGDEVVLVGEGGPSVYEAAAWAETITYEVCCRVGPRVPRHHTDVT